jgi:hypothetical protein
LPTYAIGKSWLNPDVLLPRSQTPNMDKLFDTNPSIETTTEELEKENTKKTHNRGHSKRISISKVKRVSEIPPSNVIRAKPPRPSRKSPKKSLVHHQRA